MTTLGYFVTIITSVGTSIITCIFMEAYHQRRSQDEVGRFDKGME